MEVINSVFSAYVSVLGGKEVVLTILGFPFIYTVAYLFFRIANPL